MVFVLSSLLILRRSELHRPQYMAQSSIIVRCSATCIAESLILTILKAILPTVHMQRTSLAALMLRTIFMISMWGMLIHTQRSYTPTDSTVILLTSL